MSKQQISEQFLNALRKYFNGDILIDDAVKESGLKTRKQFQFKIKAAYKNNFINVLRPIDSEKGKEVKNWIRRSRGITKDIEVIIVNDTPEDDVFFSAAAEKVLCFLKELLLRDDKEEINIGIVSGTSVADTIEYAVKDGFWEEVMGGTKFEGKTKDGKEKSINIVAICSTTLEGWDLEGNANNSTLLLAKMLRNKLKPLGVKVTPYGISTELVVYDVESNEVDKRESSKMILRIVDPKRVDQSSNEKSRLDILIAGVGSSKDSKNVLQKVIREEKGVQIPDKVKGDVGFWPIDEEGKVIEIFDTMGKKLRVYSLITPEIMRELAGGGGFVILIARNRRHKDDEVSKTVPIRAAIRGNFGNVIITDGDTANKLMEDPL